MPRESKAAREARWHQECLAEFGKIQDAVRDERQQCRSDRRFVSIAGAQWEGPWAETFEHRPKIEINKCKATQTRVVNEYRNSRLAPRFAPRKPMSEQQDKVADLLAARLRADEHDSNADEAFDNAFEEACAGGIGAFRLRAAYEDEDYGAEDGPQVIRIEPIFDADISVFWDLNCKRQDKSDARSCYVLFGMSRAAYKEEWGDDPTDWPADLLQDNPFDWVDGDKVYVAEVYRKELQRRTEQTWRNAVGDEVEHYLDDVEDEVIEDLKARGYELVKEEKERCRRVRKLIMSGGKVLKDCGFIAGKHIPIIMVYGNRWYIDGIERAAGVVRYARDSQVLHNVQASKLAEIASVSSQSIPIVNAAQIKPYEYYWQRRNLDNLAYLPMDPLTDSEGNDLPLTPPPMLEPPNIPPALAALLPFTDQSMQDILGRTQEGQELLSGVSGRAVQLVQQRMDMVSAIYITNMAKAMTWFGKVWLDMAVEVYGEDDREMRVMSEDGEVDFEVINTTVMVPGEGAQPKNMLRDADMDVFVDVGPSSASARAATVQALTGMIALTPPDDVETKSILTAMAMMNMEGEGIGDVRKFFRKKLLSIGAVEPTEQEAKEMAEAQAAAANQPPDPQVVLAQSMAQKEQAQAQKYAADTQRTIAETEKTQVETAKLVQEVARGPVRE